MQPATIARKTTGDGPLLETGQLRDSIQWNSDAHEAYVGTDNPKGIWHEFGTATIPPRPFLGAASTAQLECIAILANARAPTATIAAAVGLSEAEFSAFDGDPGPEGMLRP